MVQIITSVFSSDASRVIEDPQLERQGSKGSAASPVRYIVKNAQAGDIVRYGENYYLVGEYKESGGAPVISTTRVDPRTKQVMGDSPIRTHNPKDYNTGAKNRANNPNYDPNAPAGSSANPTGVNSIYDSPRSQRSEKVVPTQGVLKGQEVTITQGRKYGPAGDQRSGVKVEARDAFARSLDPRTLRNSSGVDTTKQRKVAGVYVGGKGEQVIVQEGRKAPTAGALLDAIRSGPYQPTRLQNSPYLKDKVVGVRRENSVFLGPDSILVEDEQGRRTVLKSIPLSAVNGFGNRNSGENRSGSNLFPDFLDRVQESPKQVGSVFQRAWMVPASVKTEINQSKEIGDFLVAKAVSGNQKIDRFFASLKERNITATDLPIIKFQTKLFSTYPLAAAGVTYRDVFGSEQSYKLTVASVGIGQGFGLAAEGVSFVAARQAATTATDTLLVRASAAGVSKGLQVAPYVLGAGFLADIGVEAASKKNETEVAGFIGSQIPGAVGFTAGDISARGKAQQIILKTYAKFSGAKELPAAKIVEPGVLAYYERGPDAPGAAKFSVITPAGNLQANKRAFEAATFYRPTYTQQIVNVPVDLRISKVDPFKVPSNPDIIVRSRVKTGSQKNYDVITATQGFFSNPTTVLRGTSKQGGLYVSPTRQAQLYFLGIGPKSDYAVGLAGYSEPNLVRVRNIKEYSEDLVPLFKKYGQGAQTETDLFLRENAKPKTAYVESRTYFGETPEVQAIIPEGTPLKQFNLRTRAQKFFGFRNYIMVGDTLVPVRSFSALKRPSATSTNVGGVKELVLRSESYSSYRRTIDPARSLLGTGGRESSFVKRELQSYRGISSRSSVPSYFLSRSTRSSRSSSSTLPLYESLSSGRSSKSILSSRSSIASSSIIGSSQSISPSRSLSKSISRSSGRSGRSTSPVPPYTPRKTPDLDFTRKKIGTKRKKKDLESDRPFFFTPTLLAADLGIEGSPFGDVVRTNLAVRPVVRRT